MRRLAALGYRGDYSFEVFDDDDQQIPLPLPLPDQGARASAEWLGEDAPRRAAAQPPAFEITAPSP